MDTANSQELIVEIKEMLSKPGASGIPPLLSAWLISRGKEPSWTPFSKSNLGSLFGQGIMPLRLKDIDDSNVQEEVAATFPIEDGFIRNTDCSLMVQSIELKGKRRREDELMRSLQDGDNEALRDAINQIAVSSGRSSGDVARIQDQDPANFIFAGE